MIINLSNRKTRTLIKAFFIFLFLLNASSVLAESGSVSYESSVSLTSALADKTKEDAKVRLDAAQTRLTTAQNNLRAAQASGDQARITAAQQEVTVAQQEVTAATAASASANSSASSAAATLADATKPQEPSGSCDGFWNSLTVGCIVKGLYDGFVWMVSSVVIFIGGSILYIAGLIFDYSLWFSIFKFKDILGGFGDTQASNVNSSIYGTWIMLRNLFNIIIVFQLLRIAFAKIVSGVLSIGGSRTIKKQLISVIIFTLFVNFSFFFTKALIDLSNIATLQFYSGLGASGAADTTGKFSNETRTNIGIAIVEGLGIHSSIFFSDGSAFSSGGGNGSTDSAARIIAGVTSSASSTVEQTSFESSLTGNMILFGLLLLAAFVLIQGASIFIGRIIYLIIIVITSPLMFAKGIVGFVDDWSKKWWEMFMEQLFVAPIFMAMLYLTLKVAGTKETGGLVYVLGQQNLSGVSGFFGGIAMLLIQGAIMAGLFISAVSLAKKFAKTTAGRSISYGSKVMGGGVGVLGRSTAGRLSNRLRNSQRLQDWAAKGGVGGAAALRTLQLADKGANSTFDYRNSETLQKAGKVSGKFGLDLGLKDAGAGNKNGFVSARADRDKTRQDKLKTQNADRIKLLTQDTYGMTDEQKKAAELRNQDRAERYQTNKSLPYTGNETGGEHFDDSKTMDGYVSEIDNLQKEMDRAEKAFKSAELTRDPQKIKEAKEKLDQSKSSLDQMVAYNDASLQAFLNDEENKNTDLAKILEDTAGMEDGPARRAAVRRNLQKIADFKRAQEGFAPTLNNAARNLGIAGGRARSALFGTNSLDTNESGWQKRAKDTRTQNVRTRANQAAEDSLKKLFWNDKDASGKDVELAAPKTKAEVTSNLRRLIADSAGKPREQARYRAAMRKIDAYHNKLVAEGSAEPAAKNEKPKEGSGGDNKPK